MYIIYIAENKYFDYSYNGNEENELEKILTPFTAKNEIIPKCISRVQGAQRSQAGHGPHLTAPNGIGY